MCLYPQLIYNPKYKKNKKNGGVIPPIKDKRVLGVPIGCGDCMECRKKKGREWQVRLLEETRTNKKGIFVTLTFSNERFRYYYRKLKKANKNLSGYDMDNAVAVKAIDDFNNRWKKEFKKFPRHYLVTELGHNGTENIHMHGIIWTDEHPEKIRKHWKINGYAWLGNQRSDGSIENYVSEKTVNYIIKYISKVDEDHKLYKPKILCSKGIGRGYIERTDVMLNKYKGDKTDEGYRTRTGHTIKMPIYYRNKIYTEEEREQLWLIQLDKDERWIGGERIGNASEKSEEVASLQNWYREVSKKLGYGGKEKTWERKEYEESRRILLHGKRLDEETIAHEKKLDAIEQLGDREIKFGDESY